MATLTFPKSRTMAMKKISKLLGRKATSQRSIGMSERDTVVLADGNPSGTDTLTGMTAKAVAYVPSTSRVYATIDT
jgi:hypothetical protein